MAKDFGGFAGRRRLRLPNPLPSQHTLNVPSPTATAVVEPLSTSSSLVDQFVCRESNGLSADRPADVIPVVLRQSTSLTSTPPLRPWVSSNINKSPSLWYLATSYVWFDLSTRIVVRSMDCRSPDCGALTCSVPAVSLAAIRTSAAVTLALFSAAICIAFARGVTLYEAGREDAYGGRSGCNRLCGRTMSSIKRSCRGSSPFNVGLGPRNGRLITFHGHSGGSIHSTTSRVA